MEHLKRFNFDDNELKKLADITTTKVYQPEDLIIKEGERDRSLLLVNKGIVKVVISKDGQQQTIPLPAGVIVGELNFTIPLHRTADVRALEETEVIIFNYHDLCQLLVSDDDLAIKLFNAINLLLIDRIHNML